MLLTLLLSNEPFASLNYVAFEFAQRSLSVILDQGGLRQHKRNQPILTIVRNLNF